MVMLKHLIELRQRLLQICFVFMVFGVSFFIGAPNLLLRIVSPLLQALPGGSTLIATQITAPLWVPIKLAMHAAMLCTMPYVLFQLWRFVGPGLYRRERAGFRWVLVCSFGLFGVGVLFGFYLVLPLMFQCLAHALPAGFRWMPDIAYAVDFITRTVLLFGICFQVPLLCVVLVYLGVVSIEGLKAARPYVIVFAFILGMLLTPPDVFSQILLALPLWFLYELGVALAQFGFIRTGSPSA